MWADTRYVHGGMPGRSRSRNRSRIGKLYEIAGPGPWTAALRASLGGEFADVDFPIHVPAFHSLHSRYSEGNITPFPGKEMAENPQNRAFRPFFAACGATLQSDSEARRARFT